MQYQDVDINGRARLEVGLAPRDHEDGDGDDYCDGYGRSRRSSRGRGRARRRKAAVQDVAQT